MIELFKKIFGKNDSTEIVNGVVFLENEAIIIKSQSEKNQISKTAINSIKRIYVESYKLDYSTIEIAIIINFYNNKELIVLDHYKGFKVFYYQLFKLLEIDFNLNKLYKREGGPIRIYPMKKD